MATKRITDLQLRDDVDATVNFPGDDSIQTYRVTAAQVKNYVLSPENVLRSALAQGAIGRRFLSASIDTTYGINLDTDDHVFGDASGGTFTMTLPTAVGKAGRIVTIERTDLTFTTDLIIATTSSQTINGATTRKLKTQNERLTLVSDGANWIVLEHSYPRVWTAFTPVLSVTTNVTPTGVWRRDGDCFEASIRAAFGGANTQGAVQWTLPITMDSAKIPHFGGENELEGKCDILDADVGLYKGSLNLVSSTVVGLKVIVDDALTGAAALTSAALNTNTNVPMTYAVDDKIFAKVKLPVVGWEGL